MGENNSLSIAKQIASEVIASRAALLAIFAVSFAKPWDDQQSWGWRTLPFEGLRADLREEFVAVTYTLTNPATFYQKSQ